MRSLLSSRAAFSLVEVIATVSFSAVFFTAATLVHQSVTANSRALGSIESVALGEAVLSNLFGIEAASINVYAAPNHGRGAFAGHLAEQFRDDVAASAAVYCLGRNGLNDLRPNALPYPAGSDVLDTPERFLAHLEDQFGAGETDHFVGYSGPSLAQSLSIFLIQPGGSADDLSVLAIYEIDVIPVTGLGSYVAVRRFVDGEMTAGYDVLFPDATGTDFNPLAVHFSRRALAPHEADADAAKFMVAEEHPFYFVWWPDPAARTLESHANPPNPAAPSGSAVWEYFHLGGRTRFQFTVAAFPSQQ